MVITFSNIKGSTGGGGATGGTVTGITLWSDETTKAYIDNALSGVTDVLSAYTKTEDFATINGSAITSGGNIVVEATPYTAGTNIDITDHIISVTGITIPTKVSELVNDSGYITTADTQNFVTSGDVQTQINDSISGKADSSAVTAQISEVKQEIEAEIPSKVSDLQNDLNFVNSGDVKTQIDNAVSGKQDTLVSGENIKTINNQSLLGSGNIEIQGGNTYTAGANIDISTDNVISVTGITLPTSNTAFTNDAGYVTSGEVESQITDKNYATENWVQDQVSGKLDTSAFTTYTANTKTELDNKQDISGMTEYATTAFTENTYAKIGDIPTKTSDLTNDSGFITNADIQDFITSGDVQTQIDNSISGKLDTDAFTTYTANTKTEIDNAVSGKVDSSRVDEIEEVTASALVELHSTKQDILVSGTNIKTINNESILGSGNIVIQGGSGSDYSAGANIDISTDNVISVTGITVPTKLSELTNDEGFVNSGEVETQITSKGYITGYTETDPVFQASAASGITEQNITNWNNKLDSSALTPYYTSAQTDTAIDNAVSGKVDSSRVDEIEEVTASALVELHSTKQDTLVSGVNIKTINNQSLLGSGNIQIQGGSGGGSNIIELTQAEYDALTAYTEDAIYVITDSQAINMDNYATTGALGSYYTSAETDTAISNAISGKTDKVSVTESSSGYKFPKWNNQGCITGTYSTAYQASQSINGSTRYLYSTSSSSLPTIYAPTSAGSAGQPLLSNGSGAPVWASYKFQFISQSQYDALATKDSTTIYFIVNEN